MTAAWTVMCLTCLRCSHPEHICMLRWWVLYSHSSYELCIGGVALAYLVSYTDQPESWAIYSLQLWSVLWLRSIVITVQTWLRQPLIILQVH